MLGDAVPLGGLVPESLCIAASRQGALYPSHCAWRPLQGGGVGRSPRLGGTQGSGRPWGEEEGRRPPGVLGISVPIVGPRPPRSLRTCCGAVCPCAWGGAHRPQG